MVPYLLVDYRRQEYAADRQVCSKQSSCLYSQIFVSSTGADPSSLWFCRHADPQRVPKVVVPYEDKIPLNTGTTVRASNIRNEQLQLLLFLTSAEAAVKVNNSVLV